jgi:protein-S-isoprenylcysteine O-methyltransferase Ste14
MRASLLIAVPLWGALAGLRLLQAAQHQQLIPALLAFQAALAAVWLVSRRPPRVEATGPQIWVAWASAFTPLALQIERESLAGQTLTILGLGLALWALWQLGRSFGIAPADRGLVSGGPYRWVRHPMYLGELLALTGAVVASPSPWNLAVLAGITAAILARIRWEEPLIFGYTQYAVRVPWRLLPGLW